MDFQTLETVRGFGRLTIFCHTFLDFPEKEWFFEMASSVSPGKPPLLIFFEKNSAFYTSGVWENLLRAGGYENALSLLKSNKKFSDVFAFSFQDESFLFDFSSDDKNIALFFQNLRRLQNFFGEIFLVLESSFFKKHSAFFSYCENFVFYASDKESAQILEEDVLKNVFESAPKNLSGNVLWLFKETAPEFFRKRFLSEKYLLSKNESPRTIGEWIQNGERLNILKKNRPDGFYSLFLRFWPLLFILFFLFPIGLPLKVQTIASLLRDMRHERNALSEAPFFEYVFDGEESLQRLSRYAVGRFHSTVTTPSTLLSYMAETLEKNSLEIMPQEGGVMIPSKGTKIKFYPFEALLKEDSEMQPSAWQYFCEMISDSIAYLTELYHKEETSQHRKHGGIDLAARRDARILSPFSARAWTQQNERGGTIIGLVGGKFVILFMHCDKLLYLNGENVLSGDPIATVGVTGNTTGPHVHIVTGIVKKNGEHRIGNVRYEVIDPAEWYIKLSEEEKAIRETLEKSNDSNQSEMP